MEFKINDMTWKIEELSQEEIKTLQNKIKANEEENVKSLYDRYYGVTYFDNLKIYLDKDLPKDRKRKTLLHELMHCFINCYITHLDKKYEEEDLCDISANSHDIIHEIVERYFKNGN